MYTTHEQFMFYKDFAYRYFAYVNGKINYRVFCNLEVDYSDMVNYTFANIRRPNKIFLHIDNIVQECGNGYNKNAVCSLIIIALTHELFHVEQVMSQEQYNIDIVNKTTCEKSVNAMTFHWLSNSKNEIDKLFGVNLDLSYLETILDYEGQNIYKDWMNLYFHCSVADMYRYTIMNVIFRNDTKYKDFEQKVLNKYDTIVISFQNGPNFLIKNNGEFCDLTLNEFVSAVGAIAGKYDRYTVNVNVMEGPYRDKRNVAFATFTLSNGQIYPMSFRSE